MPGERTLVMYRIMNGRKYLYYNSQSENQSTTVLLSATISVASSLCSTKYLYIGDLEIACKKRYPVHFGKHTNRIAIEDPASHLTVSSPPLW